MVSYKVVFKQLCPPVVWDSLKFVNNRVISKIARRIRKMHDPANQDLGIYWNKAFADKLENWGEGTVWNEVQFLLANCRGRILDIACGTGKTIDILSKKFSGVVIYGCDISDLLIERAVKKGIPRERLKVCDVTNTDYDDNYFDYAYSIGSLEHFTEGGIVSAIKECSRIVKIAAFHQIPISESGENEGWVKCAGQSYFNNNLEWWINKFKQYHDVVYILDSAWRGGSQTGKWFICLKRKEFNPKESIWP